MEKIELFDYQREIAENAAKQFKSLLFMDTGTGKTFTSFQYCIEVQKYQPVNNVLFIAPKHTHEQLREEYKVFCDEVLEYTPDFKIHIENYQMLIRKPINLYEFCDIIIIDEAHRIKGQTSKIGLYVKSLTKGNKRAVAMTGTAVCNKYGDMFMISNNINKDLFYYEYDRPIPTYNDFMKFCYNVSLEKNRQSNRYYYKFGDKLDHTEEYIKQSLVGKVFIKNAKFKNITEPKPIIINVDGMNKTKEYKELAASVITNKDGSQDTMIFLTKEMKLRQAALGFYYDQEKNPVIFSDKYVKVLDELIYDFVELEEKVIIVYQFETELEMIKTSLSKEAQAQITTDVEQFKRNKNIMLLHISKSEGLNLQFSHIMVFYSYDYSYYKFKQAIGRIYRTGQEFQPVVYVMKARNTIYEEVYDSLINKKSYDDYVKSLEKYR